LLKGFKDFLLRGNVVDLAVAVVVGAAFTAVVTAFTNAFLKPLIQLVSGGGEFAGKIVVNDVEFDYATFINSVMTFVLTAAVIYIFVVYPLKWLQERRSRGEDVGQPEPTDSELLAEIRDLLRQNLVSSARTGEQQPLPPRAPVGPWHAAGPYRRPPGRDPRDDDPYLRPARPPQPPPRHSAYPADAQRR